MTDTSQVPEVRFDESIAQPIYPRPVLKQAALVEIPKAEGGHELPTCLKVSWGVQVFYGDYYLIISGGKSQYGSAYDQWRNMHTQVTPDYWVKTAIPTAYRATEPCRIVTLIPSEDGGIRETSFTLEVGDWIVRQPGGEVQHIKAHKFDGIYFSNEEAVELGLTVMSAEEFADWAKAQVSATVSG